MGYKTITYRENQGIGVITLNRNDHANSLNQVMISELSKLFQSSKTDSLRAIVLQHTGHIFSAGLDLEITESLNRIELETLTNQFIDLLLSIKSKPVPVLAAVDGKIMGGAAGLVAACDLVLITERASLSLPEVMSGMIPALILPFLLNRIHPGKLKALGVGAFEISGSELIHCGFADRMETTLDPLLKDQFKRIDRSQPDAIRAFKELTAELEEDQLNERLHLVKKRLHQWLNRDRQLDVIKSISSGDFPFWNDSLLKQGATDD